MTCAIVDATYVNDGTLRFSNDENSPDFESLRAIDGIGSINNEMGRANIERLEPQFDRLHLMSDTVDAIADLATRIADIRRRMNEIDQEKMRLRADLDDCTARFAAITTGVRRPATGSAQMDDEILRLLRNNPDRFFTSVDIESFLRRQDWRVDGPYIRTKLARLAKRGTIRRVGHGRYMDKG